MTRQDSTRQDPLVGTVIDGRYLVESLIARGGMARVYLALDQRLSRRVALKVMHEHLATDPEFVSRFIREARSAAQLTHPNVVQVFDQGSDQDVLYLAMEYLPGRTLRDVLIQRGALTPRESLSVLEPMLGALAAAHRAGFVHGDVKPENVILSDDGRIKVADFGLARAITAPISATANGELIGTVAYLAPELVSRGVGDARADVYAAGIVLFELLTGKQPFTGSDPLQVAYRHVHETVPAPSSVAPELPTGLDGVVIWATSHDPDRRPPDAGALLADLRAAVSRVPARQLDVRAVEPVTRSFDATQVIGGPVPGTAAAPAPAPPAPAQGPQTTQILAVSRRDARKGGPPLVPRLAVHDEPDEARPRSMRRRIIATLGVLVVLAVVIYTGVWWFADGPGSYLRTPSVVGQRESDAQRVLSTMGLSTKPNPVHSETVAAGQVLASDPAAGANVKRNGTVTLTVSAGPELIAVPDMHKMTLLDAKNALNDQHLKVGKIQKKFSVDIAKDLVISSTPKAGTQLNLGTVVNLVVSKGIGGNPLKGVQANLCIAVPPGDKDNQAPVTLQNCDGSESQAWNLTSQQQLTLYNGTKCLDVPNNSSDDGVPLQIWDCNGGPNQQWTINPDGTIVGTGSGKCLDAADRGTAVGTVIQTWQCSGDPNQQWSHS